MAATLRPLSEALQGRPSPAEATKVIATYAAIPAAIAGIIGGAALVPTAADSGFLLLAAGGGAVAAALGTVLVVHGISRICGYRAVVCMGSAGMGAILSFGVLILLARHASWPARLWLSTLGAAVGAVVGGVLGWSIRASASAARESENTTDVQRIVEEKPGPRIESE